MSSMSIAECIRAGYPSVIIQTAEEMRAIEKCYDVAKAYRYGVYGWSCTKGIFKIAKEKNEEGEYDFVEKDVNPDAIDPLDAMQKGSELSSGNYLICFLDFHHYLRRADVLRAARDMFEKIGGIGVHYIFISSHFDIPNDWEDNVVSISLDLPTKDELKSTLNEMLEDYRSEIKGNPNEMDELVEKASQISLGLTITQAENAFATSISKTKTIDLPTIEDVKAQIICKDGLLEFWNTSKDVEVGGMQTFKKYTRQRLLAFSDKAREYGLPYPKGVLLVGIPGCGKSLAAKSLAKQWSVPLIKCDLGKLFGGYVGDTETNTRKALKTAEAMAPCVLWIDEIEKGLAGANSSGRNDSGVSSRMFASILTWMQEKSSPVYVVATANRIDVLPSELLRKGRFDEIFFVDLPTEDERKEIVNIQLKKIGRTFEQEDVDKVAEECSGFTGAEIEEAVVSAMFNSYEDNERELTADDIISVMKNTNPSSQGIMSATVDSLRSWAKNNGVRNASSNTMKKEENSESSNGHARRSGRKIITTGGDNE